MTCRAVAIMTGSDRWRSVGHALRTRLRRASQQELAALDDVLLPIRRLGRLDRTAAQRRGLELLDSMGIAAKAGHTPDRMAGGERQRVAVARACQRSDDGSDLPAQ